VTETTASRIYQLCPSPPPPAITGGATTCPTFLLPPVVYRNLPKIKRESMRMIYSVWLDEKPRKIG